MQRSFNRTFMELKCITAAELSEQSISFNRTFMELKWSCNYISAMH